jgi:chromatin remodeling complex protein RSC6
MVKTTAPVTPAPVDAKKKTPKKEVAAPAPVAETPAPVEGEAATDRSDISAELNDDLAELLKNVQARSALDTAIKASVKAIEKKVAKLTKMMEKSQKKRKTTQNKMSGFEKPTAISDELAKFVGEQPGVMLARTAVSKKIHEYVKSNNLQNPTNRRIINPDAKLKKLLNTKGNDELSYFNLQKYLKVHFKKSDAKA